MAEELGEEPRYGLAAGAVGGEDLGKEEPEGEGWTEEAVAFWSAEVVGQTEPAGGRLPEVVERCVGELVGLSAQGRLGSRHGVSFSPEALPIS